MELEFKRKEKIVGLFVLSMLILMLGAVVIIGRGKDWFKSYAVYYATFSESYNLQEHAEVKLYKTKIGKVKTITLTGDRVEVKLAILREYASRVKADSVAIVESPTFIGDEYVSIYPGDPKAPPLPEGGEILSGAKRSISDILQEFEVEKTARILIKAVQDIAETASLIRDPEGPLLAGLNHLKGTLQNIEAMTATIRSGEGTIGGLVQSDTLLRALHADLDHIQAILSDVRAAANQTPETVRRVNDSLEKVYGISDQLHTYSKKLDGIIQETEKALTGINELITVIKAGGNDVPVITRTARDGIQEIRRSVENINQISKALQQHFLIRSRLPAPPPAEPLPGDLR